MEIGSSCTVVFNLKIALPAFVGIKIIMIKIQIEKLLLPISMDTIPIVL